MIFAVIVTVAGVETWTEQRAGRAIRALSELSAPRAAAWRDGTLTELPPEDLVPGDAVLLAAGSRVPADLRILESEELLVDESLVTGESQPVPRTAAGAAGAAGEAGSLMCGTHVVRGRAVAEVTAIGSDSTLGRVAGLVRGAETQRTPLQKQVRELARGLLFAAVAISALVPAIGILRGQPPRQMLLSGLTLAFATIPEELPILVVVVLGLGSLRLARRGAIVRRLVAAETLGATTLILTDKTGTLTANRMTLKSVVAAGGDAGSDRVKQVARLASESSEPGRAGFVDPMDAAVWHATAGPAPEIERRFSFDGDRRLATGVGRLDGRRCAGVKGAPDEVLERSGRRWETGGTRELTAVDRERVIESATSLAAGGDRVLAVASRELPDGNLLGRDDVERDLVFEGLLVFGDPLRPEVPGAVRALHEAGVRIAIVTGDQAATAAAIAREAGIDGPIHARARPEDKLRLVRDAQAAGEVVAVTGDGVNDAAALSAAAIGVAMGRTGSDVAREAADLVLTDDNFATLATATSEGRRLYENLRKAVRYYLAIKLALVTVTFAAAVSGLPLPFAPVQIVVLELFMDLGASVAFVHQAAEDDEMRRPPRDPRARFLDRSMLLGIAAGGWTLALISGGAFFASLPALGIDGARTLALASWLVGHAALGIVMGWERRPVSLPALVRNPAMLGWAAAALLFALALLTVPALASSLHAHPVPAAAAAAALLSAAILPLWLEITKR